MTYFVLYLIWNRKGPLHNCRRTDLKQITEGKRVVCVMATILKS